MTTLVSRTLSLGLAALVWSAAGGTARAVDFHVTTAQELQNALTLAAGNGAPDTIWLAAGYYTGNFNFNSAEAADLTLQPEPGVDANQVTIDGAGTGRALNLACSAAANITVTNLTFVRNCGSTANAALRVSTSGADVSVGGCRFLGSTNHAGRGIEIVSGRNTIVRSCSVNRTGSALGEGITISGITGELRVDGNVVSGTGVYASGGGIRATVTAQGAIWVTGNTVSSNSGSAGAGIYTSGEAVISGNTVTGNSEGGINGGGGICASGSVTINNNIVIGNSFLAGNGGGICAPGPATITSNTVAKNRATYNPNYGGGFGGGIYGSGMIIGNIVTDNSSLHGGGIVGSGTIKGNTAARNSAEQNGGGIYGSEIEDNTVTDNFAGYKGGGIYSSGDVGGNVVLRNRITGTRSTYGGAGIYAAGATLKLVNNVVAGNIAPSGTTGGGLWVEPSTRLELINNTVTGNSSGNGGGAAISISGVTEQLYAYNNILWGNSATGNGKDVWLAGTGQRKEFLYNNAHDLYGVWDIAQNNIDAAPLFYDPLHDDYHLRFGSPGIDGGTNAVAMLPATDLDGDARVLNTAPDLGADEFNNQDYHPADVNQDWAITDAEYTSYAAAWKNDQTWSPGPVPIPADFVTRAGYLKTLNSGAYHNAGGPKPVCWKTGAP